MNSPTSLWNTLMGRGGGASADAAAGVARGVLVTGAESSTGVVLMRKLCESMAHVPRALVSSEEAAAALRESLGEHLSEDLEVVVDEVTSPESALLACKGMGAVIVASSAVPRPKVLSSMWCGVTKVATLGFGGAQQTFWFEEGQTPEDVDWMGTRHLVEAANMSGVKHMVLISKMAGSKPDHPWNANMENQVRWQRKAESYLIGSKLPYTIIHVGTLSETLPGGQRQLVVGVDDEFLEDGRAQVSSEDLAEVCLKCLGTPAASAMRSFDLGSCPEGEGEPFDGNLANLLEPLQGKSYTYTQADEEFCAFDGEKSRACCVGTGQAPGS